MSTIPGTGTMDSKTEDSFCPTFVVDKPFNTPLLHDSAYSSPRLSQAWPCSDSMSESCSGSGTGSGTWSSPAASIAFSPSPRPASFYNYSTWAQAASGPTLQHYTSLNQVQFQPDAQEVFAQPVIGHPYYQAPYPQPTILHPPASNMFGMGGWTGPDYSRASSERFFSPSPACTDMASVSPSSTPARQSRTLIKQEPCEQDDHVHVCSTSAPHNRPQPSRKHSSNNSSKVSSFPCPLLPYGCPATFTSKNEWKRHLNTQHLHLSTWRCDLCPQKPSAHAPHTNDFNRKDLFVQHLRRMHCLSSPVSSTQNIKHRSFRRIPNTVTALEEAETRCHVTLRDPPPACCCIFCPVAFSGAEAWVQRTEHVARHLEKMRREGVRVPEPETWNRDVDLETWLVRQDVLAVVGGKGGRRVRVRSGRARA